ncbi:hypothetical protein [Aquimarina sp. MMG016]|uniref:hypothetical protein n=1 Tax=Aquimarina sp. MMG016 TaxID=2822690 RepID=UPI001B3A0FB6|nr:hypothetical protein [Aquimarina sp. MMG016]MBQ4820519.1 hypothetical protein [Aquimarina sp. MMG016]
MDDIPYKNSDLIGQHYIFQGVEVIPSQEALLKFDIDTKEGIILLKNAKKIKSMREGVKFSKEYNWHFTCFIEFRNNLKPNLIITATP